MNNLTHTNYTLTYSTIDITSNDFKIDNQIFDNKQEIYFIPTVVFTNLLEIIKDEQYNNYTFILKYLNLVNIILKAKDEISYLNFKEIDYNYKSIINLFRNELILNRTPYNTEEKKAFRYNIKSSNKWTFLIIEEVNNVYIKEYLNELDNNHICNNEHYINTLCNAKINLDAAIKSEYLYYLDNSENGLFLSKEVASMSIDTRNKKFAENVITILRFVNKRYIKKGENINRVFNSFCELSGRARKYVTIDNKYFIELDIKNCMPMLLATILINKNIEIENKYINDVCNGIFYEAIKYKAKELNIEFERIYDDKKYIDLYFNDRDEIKVLVFRSLLYHLKTIKQSNTVKIFNALYPNTYKALKNLFKDNNKPASYFFNIEAELVLNIIPDCPYFTVHDAIYVLDNQEAIKVKDKLTSKILEITNDKIKPTIKINDVIETYSANSKLEINKINIISKRKKEYLPRKEKKDKLDRYNQFVTLYEIKHTPNDIANKLNTSLKTIQRYIKEYNKSIK